MSYWIFRVLSALRWYWLAQTRYDVHSPFFTNFLQQVYNDDRHYSAFDRIAAIRRFWRGRKERIELTSLGAPSRTTNRNHRTASSLVATNAIPERSGKFLFRLALWLRPERIIEFGTNAGISTLYLHEADSRTPIATVEGNPQVSALAAKTFSLAKASPALSSYTGTFDRWLERQPPISGRTLLFVDGDHRYQPTLDYVDHFLGEVADDSVLVVADIHWSEDMEKAWEELKQRPRVTASVDTYHFGLLFLRPELTGPHIKLIQTRYKPWRVGFFT